MTRYLAIVVGLAGLTTLAACATNPATGRKQLNVLSTQEEINLGSQAAPQFIQSNGGEIPSEPIRRYVSDMGHKLAALCERPDLPWEFHVLDSSVINAFALPGGKVFISRGLLVKLENEAMLAGVLGHEIGHVTGRHINDQMAQRIAVSGLLIGLGVAAQTSDEDWLKVLGVGAGVGGSVYLLKFGRDQETEADRLGVRYMSKLGYNPVGQVQVMEVLRQASGGGRGQPEILSTHPLPSTRIDDLNKLIKKHYPNYADPAAYRFGQDAFNTAVLQPLAKLPAPKHNPKQGSLSLQATLAANDPDFCPICNSTHQ